MNEWIYVLTVEALVFGLLATLLTAQRLDVFTWPEGQTWPVFGTSVLVLLAYSLSLLVLCSVMTASRLGSLAEDTCHAFSRSAGRLVTVACLWVIFQSTVVYTHDKRYWLLVLCQLWGTTCKEPGAVLWEYSYSMYLAVLLPLLAWCAGLQIVVSGKLVSDKITRKTSARRVLTMNVVSILLLHSTYTIQENFSLGCKQECPEVDNFTVFDRKPGAKTVMSMRVLLVAFCFMCTDVVTGVLASFVFDAASVAALILFTIIHLVQMSTVPMVVMFFGLNLPEVIMWVIFGMSCALGLMDIGEAIAVTVDHPRRKLSKFPSVGGMVGCLGFSNPTSNASLFVPIHNTAKKEKISPFSIENSRRKRFMLSFGGKSAWPYTEFQGAGPNTTKKIK